MRRGDVTVRHGDTEEKNESYFHNVVEKLFENKLALAGIIIVLLEVVLVIILPFIMHLDATTPDYTAFAAAPSAKHILGTDAIGRDLFARLIYGGRTSLFVGLISTVISMLIGLPLGICAGYYRGFRESVIMRCADIFMSFPSIVLILVLVAIVGPSILSVTLVIGVLGWPEFARLIYARVLSIKEKEYVESARAVGTSDFVIILKYIMPNAIAPILITATFRTASAIILESSLSFLGMGVQAPQASWGNILYDAQSITVLSRRPWLWVPPGLALILTVLSINFFGDGIRDALDPKMKIN